jgi:cytidine deaminase
VADTFDWDALRAEAVAVSRHAYAPYSHYPVGAAATADDGGVVSSLHATGGGRLTHVVCVNGNGDLIMPCGRCRQLLWENGGAALELLTPGGVRRMDEVLPDAFGPEDLGAVDGS